MKYEGLTCSIRQMRAVSQPAQLLPCNLHPKSAKESLLRKRQEAFREMLCNYKGLK